MVIPFATVEAAEAALGRSMTWAEAAWFWYSASTPDYCLCFQNFVILFASYTLTSLPLALLELCAPAKLTTPYKLQARVRLSPVAFLRCYTDTAGVLLLVTFGPLLLIPYPVVKVHLQTHTCKSFASMLLTLLLNSLLCLSIDQFSGIRTGLPLPSLGEVAAQLLV